MSAAEVLDVADQWAFRSLEEGDPEALHYMLGVSYTRSRAGRRAGASRAGGSHEGASSAEEIDRQKAFIAVHRPIWTWLFENADVTIACDAGAPHIILGWLITSGDSVVHAVGCKRSLTDRNGGLPLSVDLVAALLGDRLNKHQVCTLELPQMRKMGSGTIGLDRPHTWSLDPSWLLTRMIGR